MRGLLIARGMKKKESRRERERESGELDFFFRAAGAARTKEASLPWLQVPRQMFKCRVQFL